MTPVRTAQSSDAAKLTPTLRDDGGVAGVEVIRQPRRTKKKRRRKSEGGSFEMFEWLIPLALFAGAAVTNVLIALRGGDNGKSLLVFSLINLAVTVPVTIGGMFVAAAAMGIDFGGIFTAALKVAAIVTVVHCIYLFGMREDGDRSAVLVLLLAAPVYWGLFSWLFRLTFMEAIEATVFIGLIQKGVNTLLSLLAAGILLKMATAP